MDSVEDSIKGVSIQGFLVVVLAWGVIFAGYQGGAIGVEDLLALVLWGFLYRLFPACLLKGVAILSRLRVAMRCCIGSRLGTLHDWRVFLVGYFRMQGDLRKSGISFLDQKCVAVGFCRAYRTLNRGFVH